MRCRPTGSWTQVFAGFSLTFLVGSVAFVILPPLGIAIWALAACTVVRRVRYGAEMRDHRAAQQQVQAQWDARWARWGGRLP